MAGQVADPFCEVIGEGTNNLIFVHGFGLNRKCWYDLVPFLQDDYKLYLIDLIGSGKSAAPADWLFSARNQAQALLTFIEKNKLDNLTLIGQSYGGGVVLLLQLLMEERKLSRLVKSLVLISPAIYKQRLPFFVFLPGIPVLGRLILTKIPARWEVGLILSFIYHNRKLADAARVDKYVENLLEPEKVNAVIYTARNLIPVDLDEIVLKIETIDIPVMIVYGKNDRVILKKSMDRLAIAIKNSSYQLLDDCGHVPQEEKPEELARLIKGFIQ